jgi:predicted DNA-binding transcriptional regulator YafY
MMLWAYEHQPVSVSEVAEHFGIDSDDAYSELYPLQGVEVAVNEEFHNLGLIVDEDGDILFDINPLIGRPRRLERSEAVGLLAVANAALVLPGMDVDALRTGVSKLETALGTASTIAVDISDPDFLETVQQATKNRECIRIEYYARWTDETSTRTVEPYETLNLSGDWYLRAHCQLRDEHRTFRIDRIEEVELTGTRHERPDPGNEAFTGGEEAPIIRIEIPSSARWMIESLPAQVIEEGETLLVEISVSSTVFLERLLLQLGADTQVATSGPFQTLGPNAAKRLLGRYEKL